MGDLQWIKLNLAMFSNRKIRYIRHLPEGNNIVLIWIMLLVLAGKCNSGGMIFLTENVPYSMETLSDELGFETATVTLALRVLENLGMIRSGGALCISNWEEYQNIDALDRAKEQARMRQKAWYDRHKKALPSGEKQKPNVRSNADLTQPNAIEKEIRNKNKNTEDKEKDVHGCKEVSASKRGSGGKNESHTADSRRQTIRTVTELFNQICVYASRVRVLSAPMEESVVSLAKRYGIENLELAFRKAAASDVLNGNNKLQFKATFGWLMDDGHLAKTLNGDYDENYSAADGRGRYELSQFCRNMADWAEGENE